MSELTLKKPLFSEIYGKDFIYNVFHFAAKEMDRQHPFVGEHHFRPVWFNGDVKNPLDNLIYHYQAVSESGEIIDFNDKEEMEQFLLKEIIEKGVALTHDYVLNIRLVMEKGGMNTETTFTITYTPENIKPLIHYLTTDNKKPNDQVIVIAKFTHKRYHPQYGEETYLSPNVLIEETEYGISNDAYDEIASYFIDIWENTDRYQFIPSNQHNENTLVSSFPYTYIQHIHVIMLFSSIENNTLFNTITTLNRVIPPMFFDKRVIFNKWVKIDYDEGTQSLSIGIPNECITPVQIKVDIQDEDMDVKIADAYLTYFTRLIISKVALLNTNAFSKTRFLINILNGLNQQLYPKYNSIKYRPYLFMLAELDEIEFAFRHTERMAKSIISNSLDIVKFNHQLNGLYTLVFENTNHIDIKKALFELVALYNSWLRFLRPLINDTSVNTLEEYLNKDKTYNSLQTLLEAFCHTYPKLGLSLHLDKGITLMGISSLFTMTVYNDPDSDLFDVVFRLPSAIIDKVSYEKTYIRPTSDDEGKVVTIKCKVRIPAIKSILSRLANLLTITRQDGVVDAFKELRLIDEVGIYIALDQEQVRYNDYRIVSYYDGEIAIHEGDD